MGKVPWRLVAEIIEALKQLGLSEKEIEEINEECVRTADAAFNSFYKKDGMWCCSFRNFYSWVKTNIPKPLYPTLPVFDPEMTDDERIDYLRKLNKYYTDLEEYLEGICEEPTFNDKVKCFDGRDAAEQAFLDKLRELLEAHGIHLEDLIKVNPILKNIYTPFSPHSTDEEFWHPLWEYYTYKVESEICIKCIIERLLRLLREYK